MSDAVSTLARALRMIEDHIEIYLERSVDPLLFSQHDLTKIHENRLNLLKRIVINTFKAPEVVDALTDSNPGPKSKQEPDGDQLDADALLALLVDIWLCWPDRDAPLFDEVNQALLSAGRINELGDVL